MHLSLTTLTTLLLATTTLAAPAAAPEYGVGPNDCKHQNYPTTDSYIAGYKHFCGTYLAPNRNGLYYFKDDNAIVATYDLKKKDNTVIKWIYKAYLFHTIDEKIGAEMGISTEYCENTFGSFMELDSGSCVLAGGLMGERLVKGGIAMGTNLRFETRQRG
ncbi:hypothetical protein FB567DRAFT_597271 [Paraphoma chrysanthemicola]|uniref:Uncharacterized protein n=1 Tax=Paraphoma chrysanthemicola TaxID=798071 RepID=A0A8K0QW20_9PLEO|nr:hypothetical protein FB567DRAFT_597271 [Paraphoma chrysanthemicola]